MHLLQPLFDNNRAWAERRRQRDPEFFSRLARQCERERRRQIAEVYRVEPA